MLVLVRKAFVSGAACMIHRTCLSRTALLVFVLAGPFPFALIASAHAQQSDQAGAVEFEQTLFVQAPEHDNGRGIIHLYWIPNPLERLCMGKTGMQCAALDYCIRTTNPGSEQCRNIGIPRSRLPHYPPGMRPARVISIALIPPSTLKGFDQLQRFYKSQPTGLLMRLSPSVRIRARIRFTRTSGDDDFNLLEVLAVPPF
jgi:hypothetical protein